METEKKILELATKGETKYSTPVIWNDGNHPMITSEFKDEILKKFPEVEFSLKETSFDDYFNRTSRVMYTNEIMNKHRAEWNKNHRYTLEISWET